MPRKPLGDRPMTSAERQARARDRRRMTNRVRTGNGIAAFSSESEALLYAEWASTRDHGAALCEVYVLNTMVARFQGGKCLFPAGA